MIAGQRSMMLILKSHQWLCCIQPGYKCPANDRHHNGIHPKCRHHACLSALGIELHGLASYPEALALAQARSFLRFQSDLKQGTPFKAEYYGLVLSIAERCAGASVATPRTQG